jgi:hypothetical protein
MHRHHINLDSFLTPPYCLGWRLNLTGSGTALPGGELSLEQDIRRFIVEIVWPKHFLRSR